MQKVFSITNRYIILTTPLILYSLLSSVYIAISTSNGKLINLIMAFLLFTLMTGAFISGWLNMIKFAIVQPDREDVNSLIKEFPSGVGEYFLPVLGSLFVSFALSILIFLGMYYIGINLIGNLDVAPEALSKALQNTTELKVLLSSLSSEQLMKINSWNMLLLGGMTLIYYFIFLYFPSLFFKDKNPFIAFVISLKDLFSRKIFKTSGIFLLIFFLNFILSVLSVILGSNLIGHFFITLVNFYFITIVYLI